jgi:CDP-diglyceride synthetase
MVKDIKKSNFSQNIFILYFTIITILYSLLLTIFSALCLRNNIYNKAELENILILPIIICIIMKIILFIIYSYKIIKDRDKEGEQILWILGFLFVGDVIMIVYWFIHLRKNRAVNM